MFQRAFITPLVDTLEGRSPTPGKTTNRLSEARATVLPLNYSFAAGTNPSPQWLCRSRLCVLSPLALSSYRKPKNEPAVLCEPNVQATRRDRAPRRPAPHFPHTPHSGAGDRLRGPCTYVYEYPAVHAAGLCGDCGGLLATSVSRCIAALPASVSTNPLRVSARLPARDSLTFSTRTRLQRMR